MENKKNTRALKKLIFLSVFVIFVFGIFFVNSFEEKKVYGAEVSQTQNNQYLSFSFYETKLSKGSYKFDTNDLCGIEKPIPEMTYKEEKSAKIFYIILILIILLIIFAVLFMRRVEKANEKRRRN